MNVSPVAADYDETHHVIKYAALATSITLAVSAPQLRLQPLPHGMADTAGDSG